MIYLDVRSPAEFTAEHYPDAINHDVELIMNGIMPDIPRDTEIRVYCRSGSRAAFAVQAMQRAGFLQVVNVLDNKKIS
jgi:rhodanese-related sulfurtransferase